MFKEANKLPECEERLNINERARFQKPILMHFLTFKSTKNENDTPASAKIGESSVL